MAFAFGAASRAKLDTCHPAIRMVMEEAIKNPPFDFTILCGHRGKEDQDKAVAEGRSRVSYPNSRHNSDPSEAIDLAPFPIDWTATKRFQELAAHVMATGDRLGVSLTWGADWNHNGRTDDEKFIDMPHFELTRG